MRFENRRGRGGFHLGRWASPFQFHGSEAKDASHGGSLDGVEGRMDGSTMETILCSWMGGHLPSITTGGAETSAKNCG